MIILHTNWDMGNQMFEYAYARALSNKYNETIAINEATDSLIRWRTAWQKEKKIIKLSHRTSSLRHLVLNEDVVYLTKFRGWCKGIVLTVKSFILRKINPKLFKGQLGYFKLTRRGFFASDDTFTYYEADYCKKKDKNIYSPFASPRYFTGIEEIIKKEMKVKTLPSQVNKMMLEQINSCNAVCVHIRRGDFLEERWKRFQVCNEDYYIKAMNYLANKIENPVFYIFSNTSKDIEWIKHNYKFFYQVQYVDLMNPDYEDLRLMYNCKHFIISNSTFSWWASYLSQNSSKIIVTPFKWINEYMEQIDIYMENMVKIEFDNENTVEK